MTTPDAHEVDRIEAIVTVECAEETDAFLARCLVGSLWTAFVRTAEVRATVEARSPLGTFSERDCTCLRLKLDRPVPVEPGLRFRISADGLTAVAVVRPWGSSAAPPPARRRSDSAGPAAVDGISPADGRAGVDG